MTISIIAVLLYVLSSYGFSLFLYDQWQSDKGEPIKAPDWFMHILVVVFSACWPLVIFILSLIRGWKR